MFFFCLNSKKSTTDERKENLYLLACQRFSLLPHKGSIILSTQETGKERKEGEKRKTEGKITGNLHKIQLSECRFFIFSFSIFCPFLPLPFLPLFPDFPAIS